jgi:hypothetical protein
MDNDENIGSFYMGRTRQAPEPKRMFPPGLLTIAAVAVLGGIIWYAYPRGAEKYASVDIPVVKADTSPIKAEPIDPGGMEVRHQDSTVFDPLEKKAGTEVEKLQPKPEEPLDKAEVIKDITAVAPQMASKDMDLQMKEAGDSPEKTAAKTDEKVAEVKPAAVKAVEAEKHAVVPAAMAAAKETPKVKIIAPAGHSYIQLGAYRDTAGAKKDWEKLGKKYPDLLGSLTMKTQKVNVPGKGLFYRLQAGKVTEVAAKDICDTIRKSHTGGCILVK